MSGLVVDAAAVGSGLVGGTFLVFSAAVMPALSRLPPADAVAVMQAVNTVIVRSPFIVVFVGTAAACAAAVVLAPGDVPTAVGAGLYLLGTFGVTLAAHVPLNNALAGADRERPEWAWQGYCPRWTRWNHVRTLAAIGAAVVLGR